MERQQTKHKEMAKVLADRTERLHLANDRIMELEHNVFKLSSEIERAKTCEDSLRGELLAAKGRVEKLRGDVDRQDRELVMWRAQHSPDVAPPLNKLLTNFHATVNEIEDCFTHQQQLSRSPQPADPSPPTEEVVSELGQKQQEIDRLNLLLGEAEAARTNALSNFEQASQKLRETEEDL
eukprot:Sspe_Gene.53985::Locus_29819_Transcript_1_1_Confidence_1.000_Length_1543::g.53985::m.53985